MVSEDGLDRLDRRVRWVGIYILLVGMGAFATTAIYLDGSVAEAEGIAALMTVVLAFFGIGECLGGIGFGKLVRRGVARVIPKRWLGGGDPADG